MENMNTEQARRLIADRDGRPHEDDWELLEAAETLANFVGTLVFPAPTRQMLADLPIGTSIAVQETPNVKTPGSQCQSYASRAKVKITTQVNFMFSPKTEQTTKVVVVTRVA